MFECLLYKLMERSTDELGLDQSEDGSVWELIEQEHDEGQHVPDIVEQWIGDYEGDMIKIEVNYEK